MNNVVCRTIEIRGQAAVVEWEDDGCPQRTVLPLGETGGGKCDAEVLQRGIPYGDDFVAALDGVPMVSPEDIACALHEYGIWTGADLRSNIKMARAAIINMYGEVLTALLLKTRGKK